MAEPELLRHGKVRDIYADGNDLLLVASDRVSVFDVVLPTPIPDKGKVLTALSAWWFKQMEDIPNHMLSTTDVPPEWAGRATRCKRLGMLPVECVVRGYLEGSAVPRYEQTGVVGDLHLPAGLRRGDKLPRICFDPTTKEDAPGRHDAPISFHDLSWDIGSGVAVALRRMSKEVYQRAARIAEERGVIIADTKVEIGRAANGVLTLGDELLTPDSSRFWLAEDWRPGEPQASYDKQIVRDWATSTGWDRTAPGPEIPDEVVEHTRQRYIDIYERLTDESWPPTGPLY